MTGRGELPWDLIPDEYQTGDIWPGDALAHSFSVEHLEPAAEFMNNEELHMLDSDIDPMDELLAEEDKEWEESDE